MPIFPLRHRPHASYHDIPRAFGDCREKGFRKHAGCDLYAPAGSEILAIGSGTVTRAAHPFYAGTDSLEITHAFGIIRYCEIASGNALREGEHVREGQIIAHVGKLLGLTIASEMLHLEMYSGHGHGPLSDARNPPYQRRGDLLDPTAFLDALPLPAIA